MEKCYQCRNRVYVKETNIYECCMPHCIFAPKTEEDKGIITVKPNMADLPEVLIINGVRYRKEQL